MDIRYIERQLQKTFSVFSFVLNQINVEIWISKWWQRNNSIWFSDYWLHTNKMKRHQTFPFPYKMYCTVNSILFTPPEVELCTLGFLGGKHATVSPSDRIYRVNVVPIHFVWKQKKVLPSFNFFCCVLHFWNRISTKMIEKRLKNFFLKVFS